MAVTRLLLLLGRFKTAAHSNSPRLFSSSAALVRRRWNHAADVSEDSDGESAVYKRALKLQRPNTVQYQEIFPNFEYLERLRNSVSLIGTIVFPFKACNTTIFGVHTFLKVKEVSGPYSQLRVLLKFWVEMAEMSVQHLKVDDLIYVSGRLESYMKVDKDGKLMHHYEVNVKEVNFVAQQGLPSTCQNPVKLEPKVSAEEIMQKRRDQLHLWQIFFANPYEWWDNRNCKKNPKAPDFSHKDTREALWLNKHDPPWIKKQLQLHDSRSYRQTPGEHRNSRSNLSPLVYDDIQ